MIDPAKTAFFIPGHLRTFKLNLFNRIAEKIKSLGGRVIRGSFDELEAVPSDVIPIVGHTPELRHIIDSRLAHNDNVLYWDRGYCRRIFSTWLPRSESGSGYYRWSINSFQMQRIRDVPDDRWRALKTEIKPWQKNGRHVVVALPTPTYIRFHRIEGWTEQTLDKLALLTDRQIVTRSKETKRPLQFDLDGAHALVAHGSNAAVEAAILGCPVFVDKSSAASLVGLTDLGQIERPIYPDRDMWCRSLAYSQFHEEELVNGTLWKLLE